MPLPIPKFIKTAFAKIGLRNNIPETTNNTTGTAGYDRGFGEINMLPEGAGGIPPDGKDFNGVLYDLSQAIQYVQSGVAFPFNQEFATAIGGYEIGAIVSDASNKSLLWVNGTENNIAFPTGWTLFKYADPTEVVRGTPLVASTAEIKAGVSAGRMVSPAGIKSFGSDSSVVAYGSAGVFTFTVPDILKSGVKKPYVIVVGAGGGCAAFGSTLSRGAGAGGSAEGIFDLTGVSTVTVTVGAGTAAAGGSSSFGSYLSATGGTAGALGYGSFPAGGVGSGGQFIRLGSSGGGPDATYSGEGGASSYAPSTPRSGSGIPGTWPGGGAGAGSVSNNGAHGAVIIKW